MSADDAAARRHPDRDAGGARGVPAGVRFGADVLVAATGVGPAQGGPRRRPALRTPSPAAWSSAPVSPARSRRTSASATSSSRAGCSTPKATAPPPDPELTARASAMPGTRSGTLVCVERPLVTRLGEGRPGRRRSTRPPPWTWSPPPGRGRPPRSGIPYVVLRAISDDALDELPGYLSRVHGHGRRHPALGGGVARHGRALDDPGLCVACSTASATAAERLAAFVEHFLAEGA